MKSNRAVGELEVDRKGKMELKLKRIDGGSDEFEIKARGLTSFWFLVEYDDKAVMELKPTEKFRRGALHYRVNTRTRRLPERVMDELSVYITFAANVYNTKMQGITTGRWPG
jgi:hypothetical protein